MLQKKIELQHVASAPPALCEDDVLLVLYLIPHVASLPVMLVAEIALFRFLSKFQCKIHFLDNVWVMHFLLFKTHVLSLIICRHHVHHRAHFFFALPII